MAMQLGCTYGSSLLGVPLWYMYLVFGTSNTLVGHRGQFIMAKFMFTHTKGVELSLHGPLMLLACCRESVCVLRTGFLAFWHLGILG